MDVSEHDPGAFERALLAELERELTEPPTIRLMRDKPARREVRGVRLDGSYPETVIVVSVFNLDSEEVEDWRYPLWERDFRVPDGTVLPMDNIASEIWTTLIEP
jgi:hypothetical protein